VNTTQRLKKCLKGSLVKAAQPAAAEAQTGKQFADEPQLRFAAFWGQTIQGDDQATVLLSGLSQAVPVLTLVAGQQWQIGLLVDAFGGAREIRRSEFEL
jgi:hypothetical protein